jgi:hypothetical protein
MDILGLLRCASESILVGPLSARGRESDLTAATPVTPGTARIRRLDAVDVQARLSAKTVLVLDTVTGGAAGRLYARAGWQRVGDIPNFALMPDGALCSTTVFHRQFGATGRG